MVRFIACSVSSPLMSSLSLLLLLIVVAGAPKSFTLCRDARAQIEHSFFPTLDNDDDMEWSTLTAAEQWQRNLENAKKDAALATFQVEHFTRTHDDEMARKFARERDELLRIIDEIAYCCAGAQRRPRFSPVHVRSHYFRIVPTAAPRPPRRRLIMMAAEEEKHTKHA